VDGFDLAVARHGAPRPALLKGGSGHGDAEVREERFDQPMEEGGLDPVVVRD
jgi:hypothetical protein